MNGKRDKSELLNLSSAFAQTSSRHKVSNLDQNRLCTCILWGQYEQMWRIEY